MQGHLWTETVRNPDQMFAMIFPRLLALAERAWHKASWEDITDRKKRDEMMKADWVKFAGALGNRELVRLDKMGVQYRVPPPGARSEAGLIKGAVSCNYNYNPFQSSLTLSSRASFSICCVIYSGGPRPSNKGGEGGPVIQTLR